MKNIIVVLSLVFASLSWGSSIPKFDFIQPGFHYLCGYQKDKFYCWGNIFYNQPISTSGFQNIKDMRLELHFGCASDDLGIVCWGEEAPLPSPEMTNSDKILDFEVDYNTICANVDSKISCVGEAEIMKFPKHLNKVTSLSVIRYLGCAVQEERLYCWGGQGYDPYGVSNVPTQLGQVTQVALSQETGCVLNSSSEIICWGRNKISTPYNPGFKVISIHSSNSTVCMLGMNGEVDCKGAARPTFPSDFGRVVKLESHKVGNFCAQDEQKRHYCWGFYQEFFKMPPVVEEPNFLAAHDMSTYFIDKNGKFLEIGEDADLADSFQTENIQSLSVKFGNICLVDHNGPRCFGSTAVGQLKIPSDLGPVRTLEMSKTHICALTKQNRVKCWSKDNGRSSNLMPNLMNVRKLVSGSKFFCSLSDESKVSCWGEENVQVPEFDRDRKILDIVSSEQFSCALLEDQTLTCWGSYPNAIRLNTPRDLDGMNSLVVGDRFICAHSDTNIRCWGELSYRQNSPNALAYIPRVEGKIKNFVAGSYHACFMDNEGVKCWGRSLEGQTRFFQ